jgi:hypothetical protein
MTDTAAPGGPPQDDTACWREAERLRRDHPGWVVLWLARLRQYRAYHISRARHATTLTAPTPGDLAAQISATEQTTSPRPAPHAQDQP